MERHTFLKREREEERERETVGQREGNLWFTSIQGLGMCLSLYANETKPNCVPQSHRPSLSLSLRVYTPIFCFIGAKRLNKYKYFYIRNNPITTELCALSKLRFALL